MHEYISDADHTDDHALLVNTPTQAESLLHSLKQAAMSNILYVKCFNQDGAISLNGKHLKFIEQFIYLGSNISSTESNLNIHISQACSAINRLKAIQKSDTSDKIEWEFFQAVAMSILLYGSTQQNSNSTATVVMDDGDRWQERLGGLCVISTTWWW